MLFSRVNDVETSRTRANRYNEWRNIEEGMWRFHSTVDISGLERDEQAVIEKAIEDMLHIPIMAGLINTALTVNWGMYASLKPIFEITPREPNSALRSRIVQMAVNREVQSRNWLFTNHQKSYDAFIYGFGIKKLPYIEDFDFTTDIITEPVRDLGTGQIIGEKQKQVKRKNVRFAGTEAISISPYDFGSDWRVPIHRIQDGEFVYQRFLMHIDDLRQKPYYFNKSEVKDASNTSSSEISQSRQQGEERNVNISLTNERLTDSEKQKGMVEVIEFQIKIVPRRYGLSQSGNREIWILTVSADGTLIQTEPLNRKHGSFTYTVATPFPFEKTTYPPTLAEMIRPLQDEINFRVNTNRISMKRAAFGWWLYDGKVINVDKLQPNEFVKFIDMRLKANSVSPDEILHQVPYVDQSTQVLKLIPDFLQWMQRATGITDITQGIPVPGRRTKAEVQGLQQFSTSRLQVMNAVMDSVALADEAYQRVLNMQQFKTDMEWVRIGGKEYEDVLAQVAEQHPDRVKTVRMGGETVSFLKMAPEDMAGNFDYPVLNPVFAAQTPEKVALFTEMFQATMQNIKGLAEAGIQVDVQGMMNRIARMSGIMDFESFFSQAQGAPGLPTREPKEEERPPTQLELSQQAADIQKTQADTDKSRASATSSRASAANSLAQARNQGSEK